MLPLVPRVDHCFSFEIMKEPLYVYVYLYVSTSIMYVPCIIKHELIIRLELIDFV